MSRVRTRTPRGFRSSNRERIVAVLLRVIVFPLVFVWSPLTVAVQGAVYALQCLLYFPFHLAMTILAACECVILVVYDYVILRAIGGTCKAVWRMFSSTKAKSAPLSYPAASASPPATYHIVPCAYPLVPITKFSFEWDIKYLSSPFLAPPVDHALKAQQRSLGSQSLRGGSFIQRFPGLGKTHKDLCFKEMIEREKSMADEWCVVYHSYSFAAPLYEVHAAIAAILYGYNADKAPLPRLICESFQKFEDAREFHKRLPTQRDHDIAWRRAVIAGSTSVYGFDPEATPMNVFDNGYSCADLSFMGTLYDVLAFCGIKDHIGVGKALIEVCARHGLSTSYYGLAQTGPTYGNYGHLLQIFIKRSAIDKLAYASMPFGVVDNTRMPLGKHFEKNVKIQGQVRICANPNAFMRSHVVQLFHYCSKESFAKDRKIFQRELQEILRPHLEGKIDMARSTIDPTGILEDESAGKSSNVIEVEVGNSGIEVSELPAGSKEDADDEGWTTFIKRCNRKKLGK